MKAWRYGLVVLLLLGLFAWFAHPVEAKVEGMICEDGKCQGDTGGSGCDVTCPPGNPGGGGKKEEPPTTPPEEPPQAGGNSTCSLIQSVTAVAPAFLLSSKRNCPL